MDEIRSRPVGEDVRTNIDFCNQIELLRTELKNIRTQMRGLKQQHKKELLELNKRLTQLKNCTNNPSRAVVEESGNYSSTLNAKCDATVNTTSVVAELFENNTSITFHPIGRMVDSWFNSKNGTPRQPTVCSYSKGTIDIIDMAKNFKKCTNPHYALENLIEFSHIWIIFVFDQSIQVEQLSNSDQGINKHFTKTKIAPPRLEGRRVGLFSTRSPHRPNLIGLTLAKLESINGTKIHVRGIDLLKGTPILDIKPYIPDYDVPYGFLQMNPTNEHVNVQPYGKHCNSEIKTDIQEDSVNKSSTDIINLKKDVSPIKTPKWIGMKCLQVLFTDRAIRDIDYLVKTNPLELNKKEVIESIKSVLQADPRSNYRKQKCSDRLYYFSLKNSIHITAWFDDKFTKLSDNVESTVESIAEVIKVIYDSK
jgi:tRNA-Thr(GGU) m(6)t(6)A37 methyltransferase TsaA